MMAGKILIYDGIASNRIILRCKLASACYDIVQAESYDDLSRKATSELPDLVICDLDQSPKRALSLCRSLRGGDAQSGLPVLMLATDPSAALRIAAFQAGAWGVMPKPLHDDLLFASLRQVLRQSNAVSESRKRNASAAELGLAEAGRPFSRGPTVIALVAETKSDADDWNTRLCARLADAKFRAVTPDQALSRDPAQGVPDAFVIFASRAVWQRTLSLVSELHSRAATQHSNLIVVMDDEADGTPQSDADSASRAAMALDLGVDDVVRGPVHLSELALRLESQTARKRIEDDFRRALQQGIELAARDPLTRLYNRRYALPRLDRMLANAREGGRPLALLALDLDRFKSVNDTHGHAAGDAVLVEVARRLSDTLRPRDLIARSGGEEFWIALPDTSEAQAVATAQAIRRLIRSNPITLPERRGLIRVTISIGVALHPAAHAPQDDCVQRLLDRADSALYAAKADGRDTVTMASCAA